MELSDYIPVLIQLGLAIAIAGGILVASYLLGQRAVSSRFKEMPYECGLDPEGKDHPRFPVKFYLTAMLFILFDVEVIYMVPWSLIYRDFLANGITILGPILFFIFVIVVGLVYEVRKGALKWER